MLPFPFILIDKDTNLPFRELEPPFPLVVVGPLELVGLADDVGKGLGARDKDGTSVLLPFPFILCLDMSFLLFLEAPVVG